MRSARLAGSSFVAADEFCTGSRKFAARSWEPVREMVHRAIAVGGVPSELER